MQKPYFRKLFHPELNEPVLVEGLPGFGNVGKIAARLLIDFAQAKLFTELYSPSLPDYVVVDKDGICHAPRYEFYASSTGKTQFIILTGDAQPSRCDDGWSSYAASGRGGLRSLHLFKAHCRNHG